MSSFLQEWLFVVSVLGVLGLAGGFALIPFRTASPFIVLAAPLAGLLLLGLGISALYSLPAMQIPTAGAVVLSLGAAATLASLAGLRPRIRVDAVALATALIASAVITLATTAATITDGSPSLSFVDGSDQYGYGTLADWLSSHSIFVRPAASPDLPYQAWAEYMYNFDPRFGCLYFLAFIAWLRGVSGLFALDSACAIALAAGTIGIAAAFAASRRTFVLLSVGLLTGYWYDHSRGGYFGKLMAYPGDFLVLRLFFHQLRNHSVLGVVMATVLAGAVGTMHSGMSTVAVILPVGAACLAAWVMLEGSRKASHQSLLNAAALLLLLCFVAASQTGVFGRAGAMTGVGMSNFGSSWTRVLEAGLDLENDNPPISGLSAGWLAAATVISLIIFTALLALAAATRNLAAIGLLAGTAVTFVGLYAKGNLWAAYQLIGVYGTALLCAATLLIDDTRRARRWVSKTAYAAVGVLVLLHLPRFVGALDRFAFGTSPVQRFSRCELDALASAVGPLPVRVDVADIREDLVIMAELGRRGADLEWSERPWKIMLGYRPWAPPTYSEPPAFRLAAVAEKADPASVVLRTPHYLLTREPLSTSEPRPGPAEGMARAIQDCRPLALAAAAARPADAPPRPAPPPSGVLRFPDGLQAPGLYFAGVWQDGWLRARSRVHLLLPGGSDVLYLSGDFPDFSTKISSGVMKIAVDGTPVLERPQIAGAFDLEIPIPEAEGPRWIDIQMSGSDTLPSPDGRTVAVRLTSIALGRRDWGYFPP